MSGKLIPPAPEVDFTTVEGLNGAMSLMEPKHFLAHPLGTLLAAVITSKIATGILKWIPTLSIGVLFLARRITAVKQIRAPICFNMTNLILFYLPMSCLGYRLAAPQIQE